MMWHLIGSKSDGFCALRGQDEQTRDYMRGNMRNVGKSAARGQDLEHSGQGACLGHDEPGSVPSQERSQE